MTEKIVITVHEPSDHSAGIRGGETRVTIEDFHSNHPEADLKQFMAEYFDVLPMQVEVQYITD